MTPARPRPRPRNRAAWAPAGIVQVVVLTEGESAVEHDVSLRVQGIGIDQHRDVMPGLVGLVAEAHAVLVPLDRQLIGDLRQDGIAAGSPHRTRLWAAMSASLISLSSLTRALPRNSPPVVDGVRHLGGGPSSDLVVEWIPGRPDHQEAIHEGVVDRALQAVPLAQGAVIIRRDRGPTAVDLAEMGRPRAVGERPGASRARRRS